MSYLQDKKIKQKKFFAAAVFLLICLFLIYFQSSLWNGLSFLSQNFFRPVLVFGNNIEGILRSVGSFFVSKNSLYLENENLKSQLSEITATMANYNSVLDENNSLKEILGRINEKPMTLSAILAKPNKSFYDTLVIDAGINQRVETGDLVFAFGNVPIGRISIAYPNSSKVVLFSDSGEKTQAIVSLGHSTTGELGDAGKNVSIEVIGRGGGNFETTMPSDFTLVKGDEVVLPGITPYVLAVVETIISDPRDPFVKVLLTSPVNIQEQKFVEIETQK